jgi:hypothetical protein
MSEPYLYCASFDVLAAFADDPKEEARLRALEALKKASDDACATYEARKRLVSLRGDALDRGADADLGVFTRIAVHDLRIQEFRDAQAELDEAALAFGRAHERFARAAFGTRLRMAIK